MPVFGPAAANVFPRVGHIHINVDDLPWHWADASDTGAIDVKDLPPGPHKITIDLVDGNRLRLATYLATAGPDQNAKITASSFLDSPNQ